MLYKCIECKCAEDTITHAEMSRFNHTLYWIRAITMALGQGRHMMSSVNDPAKSRPQMLLSTWWNEKHLLQFHSIRCRQQCHSLFAQIGFLQLNSNHKLQTIILFDCVVISKWQSSFIKKSQVLFSNFFFNLKSRRTRCRVSA